VVLPLLAGSQGLGSSVPDIRGVAADVLCSGIKTAGSAQVLTNVVAPFYVCITAVIHCLTAQAFNYVTGHHAMHTYLLPYYLL
jgi:hypothetical protein